MKRHLLKSLKLVSAAALLIGITLVLPNADASSTTLPPGIYSTTIVEADVPSYFPPEAIPILVGYWEIEFNEDGTYIVTKDGEVVANGRYNSNEPRLVMTDLAGSLACTDAPGIATGVYDWSLENDELVLASVHDGCAGRAFALTVHSLEKE
ncbi:MAG TPA: hypothetical protein VGQ39_18140 [Pyrinomonadaceae bacterium]|jgi:hypothetical protein|nr:hypothetical protein [Pyrinomonadaceae bacterium]